MTVADFRDGKIRSFRTYFDDMSLIEQIIDDSRPGRCAAPHREPPRSRRHRDPRSEIRREAIHNGGQRRRFGWFATKGAEHRNLETIGWTSGKHPGKR
jgi:hypothetical protein